MTVQALAIGSTESEAVEHEASGFPPEALAFGGGAFVVFLILVLIVTRLNVAR